ncbi:DUF1036 domain-containing protein [Stratiformator vulcanicus]|uniref:Uncharacterized protein n=1 Tax=Stratiformator vulcanicus TaxID=2527980 RepID=A0A517R5C4_9PLAN|nr:DUF1036 domain-containing protein [Stratiformator vulcanicus]QDT39097.1 hypothetical protein Pan189_34990 [Stratiformator vulcanicus]
MSTIKPGVALLFCLLCGASTGAQTVDERLIPFSVQNTTKYPLWIAIGFNEGDEFVSAGWYKIESAATLDGFYTADGDVYYNAYSWDGKKKVKTWLGTDKMVYVEDPSNGFRLKESRTRLGGKIKKVGMKKVTIEKRGQVFKLR